MYFRYIITLYRSDQRRNSTSHRLDIFSMYNALEHDLKNVLKAEKYAKKYFENTMRILEKKRLSCNFV